MPELQGDGIILGAKLFGDRHLLLSIFLKEHGHIRGLYKNARSSKQHSNLVGTLVGTRWRSRLREQLGVWDIESTIAHPVLFNDAERSWMFSSALQLLYFCLPQEDPHPLLFESLNQLRTALMAENSWEAYINFELTFLQEMGFRLSLNHCAVTGETADLAYISPKTGAAVTVQGAGGYADRLLPYPKYFQNPAEHTPADIYEALSVLGYFLQQNFYIDQPAPKLARDKALSTLKERL